MRDYIIVNVDEFDALRFPCERAKLRTVTKYDTYPQPFGAIRPVSAILAVAEANDETP
jgi:hypothetical protein